MDKTDKFEQELGSCIVAEQSAYEADLAMRNKNSAYMRREFLQMLSNLKSAYEAQKITFSEPKVIEKIVEKPVEVIKEVTKEVKVPVEVVKEVPVYKTKTVIEERVKPVDQKTALIGLGALYLFARAAATSKK